MKLERFKTLVLENLESAEYITDKEFDYLYTHMTDEHDLTEEELNYYCYFDPDGFAKILGYKSKDDMIEHREV